MLFIVHTEDDGSGMKLVARLPENGVRHDESLMIEARPGSYVIRPLQQGADNTTGVAALIREAIWTFARSCNYADGLNDSHARGVLSGAIVVAMHADALYPGEEWRC